MRSTIVYLLLPIAALAMPADAQSVATGVMPVTALVVPSCTVAALPLVFGPLSLSGGDTDTQTSIVLTCTPGTGYNVGLDAGAHASNGVRNMVGTLNGSLVPYQVYSNAARTTEWGNAFGTNTVAGTAGSAITNLTVYGRVAGRADLFPAGGYTDAVTVTVRF